MATVEGRVRDGSTPSRFVTWWTNQYTRGLPAEVRDRRVAEIASDLHDHACSGELGEARTLRLEIGWRAVRGIPADVSWRRQERRAMTNATRELGDTPLRNAWAVVTQSWFAPIAVLLGVFDLLASIAVIADDTSKMPGQAVGPVVMTALALGLFAGLRLRWRAGRADPGGFVGVADSNRVRVGTLATVVVLAFALLTVGVSTGAATVYFVALGLLVGVAALLGGTALVRALRAKDSAHRAGLADALIVAGTLPALAFFWMIIPPLLALAVIGGVMGTNPRLRVA